jgi:hypothetical protein
MVYELVDERHALMLSREVIFEEGEQVCRRIFTGAILCEPKQLSF